MISKKGSDGGMMIVIVMKSLINEVREGLSFDTKLKYLKTSRIKSQKGKSRYLNG